MRVRATVRIKNRVRVRAAVCVNSGDEGRTVLISMMHTGGAYHE